MKLTSTRSKIAVAAMAISASPSLGAPTGPAEASGEPVNESPRPDIESSPPIDPSQILGLSPALRAGSKRRRSSALAGHMSDRTAGGQGGPLDLDSVTNVADALGLGITEETLNLARDQPEADTPQDTASQVVDSAGHAADMLLPKTPIHPRSDSKGDQAGQALPFSSFPSLPGGVPNPVGAALPPPGSFPISQPLNQIPGFVPNPANALPFAPGAIPNPLTAVPGAFPPGSNPGLSNPVSGVPNPSFPQQAPNPGAALPFPNPASMFPGTAFNGLPLNGVTNSPAPGVNPLGVAGPVVGGVGGNLPGALPGWVAAQEGPASSATSKPHPSLPSGVIAPTAPVSGDVPPLLSTAPPMAAEAPPTATASDHHLPTPTPSPTRPVSSSGFTQPTHTNFDHSASSATTTTVFHGQDATMSGEHSTVGAMSENPGSSASISKSAPSPSVGMSTAPAKPSLGGEDPLGAPTVSSTKAGEEMPTPV